MFALLYINVFNALEQNNVPESVVSYVVSNVFTTKTNFVFERHAINCNFSVRIYEVTHIKSEEEIKCINKHKSNSNKY